MPIDPESLYRQLGQLVAEIPTDLAGPGALSPESHHWLGRAAMLVGETSNMVDPISFVSASDMLVGSTILRELNANQIVTILHRALARAEQNAPAAVQGAFIAVGATFDAYQAIGKVLSAATSDVLIVDAYMDSKVLTDFAPCAPERVSIRLLSDSRHTTQAALQPPAARWAQQYAALRPLEIRLTAPRLLHDRLIVVDGADVWSLTQSLKDFAARSPASVLRVDADLARLKREAYEQMWVNAQRI
jgi:hypothetical protein